MPYKERLEFLGYLANVICTFNYEDDQPMLIIEKLNRFLNNQGQTLHTSLGKLRKGIATGKVSVDEMASLQAHCEAAMCMSILLAVKLNIQYSYGITAAKVEEWRTKKSLKGADKKFTLVKKEDLFFTLSEFPVFGDHPPSHTHPFCPLKKKIPDKLKPSSYELQTRLLETYNSFAYHKISDDEQSRSSPRKKRKKNRENDDSIPDLLHIQADFFDNLMNGDELVLTVTRKEKRPAKARRSSPKKAAAKHRSIHSSTLITTRFLSVTIMHSTFDLVKQRK